MVLTSSADTALRSGEGASRAPGSQAFRCVYRDRSSRRDCHCLWQHLLRQRVQLALLLGWRQGRQDRSRLRRRRSWRPLLQRLRRPRCRQGQEGVRRRDQGADREDLGHRGRPRAAPVRPGRGRVQPDHRCRLRLRRLDGQGRGEVPEDQLRHRRLGGGRQERRQHHLHRGAGLLPGRRRRRAEVQDEARRLHRRCRRPADQEVRGGLRPGRQGHQPEDQGRHPVPEPRLGHLRLRQPRQARRPRPACWTTAPT